MAHFALLWKARTIEKYRQNYEDEKINSIIMSNADIPDKTLFQRWKHYSHGMQKRLSRKFSKWYPEGSTVSNFFVSLGADMKLPSILLRSLYGFVGGLLLTYLGFMFFVFQLSLSLMHATVLSSILGVLLTLGLTFSNRMRCLVFLLFPQLFSRVGRYTITCYALVLILTGPATNTLKNSEVLSESMACSQNAIIIILCDVVCFFRLRCMEQIKLNVRHINESVKKPYNSIKDSLKITIQSMKRVVVDLKIALIRINRLILSIASVIQSGFSWINSIVDKCNNALGTPMERCLNAINENSQNLNKHTNRMPKEDENHVKSYKDALKNILDKINVKEFVDARNKDTYNKGVREQTKGKLDHKRPKEVDDDKVWFCDRANVAELACASVKTYGKFCEAADFAEETILATIKRKLKTFTRRLNKLLYLKLNIQHTYTFIGNSSSTNQIAAGIVTEIRNRADPILTWLSWSSCVTSLFLLLIIFRAKHYQHMFETRSPFDNRFITKEFRELDLKRLREGRETVLPLNRRERAKYVTTTSFRLVASEKFHLNRSAMFMTVTTFKLMIHIIADYSLYWVLMTIRYHGKRQSPLKPGVADTGAFISGAGFVTRLLQSFIDALNLQLLVPPLDNSCLPDPYPPDIKRYSQIGFLIFLLWFFALLEPYGLRLRHLIMGHYRPERAKTRAAWLYNHILRTRASFMKFARRKLHREYKYSSKSALTLRKWLQTNIPYCWLRFLLGIKPHVARCLLCNITEEPVGTELIRCEVLNCPGTYCTSCFSDIGQLCTICFSPSDYGDLSDVSLEKGSSDEDNSSDDDNDFHDNHENEVYTRISEDGVNVFENDIDDAESKGKPNIQSKLLLNRDKSKMKDITLLQPKVIVFHPKNCVWPNDWKTSEKFENIIKYKCIITESLRVQNSINNFKCDKNDEYLRHLNNYMHCKISNINMTYQYSVYKITVHPFAVTKSESTTQIAKYLRRKKIMRRKHSVITRLKYFMICSNTNINNLNDGVSRIANNTHNDKVSKNLDKAHTETKKDGDKKNKKSKKKLNKNTIAVNDNRSKVDAKKFHTKCIDYWKNIKLKLTPTTSLQNSKRNFPPANEIKHKRKKKHKSANDEKKAFKNFKPKTNYVAGNSRLFAYLDEKDWVKNAFGNVVSKNPEKQQTKINGELDVFENKIIIPKLNLNLTSELLPASQHKETCLPNLSINFPEATSSITRDEFAEGALDRYFKSIACQSQGLQSKQKKILHNDKTRKEDKTNSLHNNKYIVYPNSNEYKSKLHCNKSQENVKTFRLKRIFSGTFSGYKLHKPLSLIRTVYSSLFRNDDEVFANSEITSEKCTQTKKGKQIKWEDAATTKKRNVKLQINEVNEKGDILKTSEATKYGIEATPDKRNDDIKHDKEIQTSFNFNNAVDKEIEVCPKMNSCGSQKNYYKVETQDCGVQIQEDLIKTKPEAQDVEVMTCVSTCTCAAQCKQINKSVGVITDQLLNSMFFGHPSCTCEPYKSSIDHYTGVTKKKKQDLDLLKEVEVYSSTYSSSETQFSSESKTDNTTVCSLSNINYHKNNRHEKVARPKIKVITKANQSTLTDKTENCDVSTTTYDWWSPIVEKKEYTVVPTTKVEKRDYKLEKKKKENDMTRERRRLFRNKGVGGGDKIVKFKSTTQLIPNTDADFLDIMSPSRYLLESQRYYNELFFNKFNSPRVLPISNVEQRYSSIEKNRSQIRCRDSRRGI